MLAAITTLLSAILSGNAIFIFTRVFIYMELLALLRKSASLYPGFIKTQRSEISRDFVRYF